jgi:tetratricopeptide (TPR) repeat protein/glycosyltransferase involved in cell wall biosynthesis
MPTPAWSGEDGLASADGRAWACPPVKVIVNEENRGFPAAANQGIRAAAGRQILLLNNDTVVTTGWLRRLLRALSSAPDVGLAGPCSNCVSGAQQVAASYEDLAGLDGFAWEWGKAHDGALADTDRLIGFCLLIRREVVDRIGLLDEQFGVGCFEDDDYCLRALRAGFRAVIARDAFVHHFGGRTFVGSGFDFAALMQENRQRFCAKWAVSAAKDEIPARRGSEGNGSPALPRRAGVVQVAPGGGLLLSRAHMQLSLCMIVRDNARTVAACLESIRPWVDEMVVVDTGSLDDTPAIAARLGARVFHFPWCDSFSAARNESLRQARGRWLFWMDSDDTIDPANGRRLRALACGEAEPALLGYVMQVHCPGPGEDGACDLTVVDHVKLIRNLPSLRFEGRIHEQILPAIRAAGGEVGWTDLFVVHAGYDHSPEGQERKKQRDLRLLELELAERPEHPFTLFNLGMTYADLGEHGKAVEFLNRSIAHSGPGESHLRKAYALLVYCQAQRGRAADARAACRRGLELFPEDSELLFRSGLLLHAAGQLREAVAAYQAVLQDDGARHFSSLDRGIRGFKARQNLAAVYTDLGDLPRAEEQWRRIVAEMPAYRAGWHGLGDILLQQGKTAEAQAVAEQLLGDRRLRSVGLVLQGSAAVGRGDRAAARQALQQAVYEFPGERAPRQVLCRFLFEQGEPAPAAGELLDLLRHDPTDASAYHNLGTVYLQMRQYGGAVQAYRRSLRHRPDWAPTYRMLGHAWHYVGHEEEARAAWQETLRLSPGDAEATEVLAAVCGRSRRDDPSDP